MKQCPYKPWLECDGILCIGCHNNNEKMKDVQDALGDERIGIQIIEECAELIQAISKMLRLKDTLNKPRKTASECKKMLIEETADVLLSISTYPFTNDDIKEIEKICGFKINRWTGVIKREIEENGRTGLQSAT